MNHNKIKRWMIYSIVILAGIGSSIVLAEPLEVTVSKGKEVSIEYTLRIEGKGKLEVIDSNVADAPLTFIHGDRAILPALENALQGMKIGQTAKVTLSPEEGFGLVNPSAIREVKKNRIPKAALKVGTKLQAKEPNGKTTETLVIEIKEDTVVLDSNHPLAGKKLYYEIKILDIKGSPSKS